MFLSNFCKKKLVQICGVVKRFVGIGPNLECNHCGFVTDDVSIWTKHDCNTIKVASNFSTRCSPDQMSVDSRQSSLDQVLRLSDTDINKPDPSLTHVSKAVCCVKNCLLKCVSFIKCMTNVCLKVLL